MHMYMSMTLFFYEDFREYPLIEKIGGNNFEVNVFNMLTSYAYTSTVGKVILEYINSDENLSREYKMLGREHVSSVNVWTNKNGKTNENRYNNRRFSM